MHSNSNNVEFMSYDNMNEVVNELFESLLLRYQIDLGTSMRGSDFIFDSVNRHKINVTKWILNMMVYIFILRTELKKGTINLKNKDDKRFQYVVTEWIMRIFNRIQKEFYYWTVYK